MIDVNDKALVNVRLRFLDICKSFFSESPDAERLARWRGIFAALIKESIEPVLDRTSREIYSLLNQNGLSTLQEEYYRLFIDPFGESRVPMTASEYREGRSYGRTLADFRGFLSDAKIQKVKGISDAEDSLVVMLDVMARLVEGEQTAPEQSRQKQEELLEEYLEPLIEAITVTMTENSDAVFFAVCARFVKGYVDLEKGLSVGA